ncbi:hypothetical protein T07_13607 [Trichinella nelsoni]|uniref:Uncharacterized protein n=1 Tax=Trichinella nelsoni TaxID=6336 RepID=A0A0V0RDX1_9BILA|nr:hypothetical protein T07_13607 [Trichinella nelsoni]
MEVIGAGDDERPSASGRPICGSLRSTLRAFPASERPIGGSRGSTPRPLTPALYIGLKSECDTTVLQVLDEPSSLALVGRANVWFPLFCPTNRSDLSHYAVYQQGTTGRRKCRIVFERSAVHRGTSLNDQKIAVRPTFVHERVTTHDNPADLASRRCFLSKLALVALRTQVAPAG